MPDFDDDDDLERIERELEILFEQGWTGDKLLFMLNRKVEGIMATLQDVIDAVDQDKAAVEAAAARVIADLGALSSQVQALSDQITAGAGVTSADLDAVKASIDAVTGEAAAIDAPPPA